MLVYWAAAYRHHWEPHEDDEYIRKNQAQTTSKQQIGLQTHSYSSSAAVAIAAGRQSRDDQSRAGPFPVSPCSFLSVMLPGVVPRSSLLEGIRLLLSLAKYRLSVVPVE